NTYVSQYSGIFYHTTPSHMLVSSVIIDEHQIIEKKRSQCIYDGETSIRMTGDIDDTIYILNNDSKINIYSASDDGQLLNKLNSFTLRGRGKDLVCSDQGKLYVCYPDKQYIDVFH